MSTPPARPGAGRRRGRHVQRLPVAQYAQLGAVPPGGMPATARTSPLLVSILLPLTAMMTSPGRNPARAAGPVRSTRRDAHARAARLRLADRRRRASRDRCGPCCRRSSTTPRGDLARHREADPDRAAGRRHDRGVHRDHLALHVEGRAAGVARVDRRVDLQEVVERPGADVAPARRDDPGGHRRADPERVARRQDPVADLDRRGCRPSSHTAAACRVVIADHRDIGHRVDADDLARQILPVRERHGDARGVADDVAVGHDDAGRVDDEAGARRRAPAGGAAGRAAGARPACRAAPAAAAIAACAALDDGDVDHRRRHPLDQRREARRSRQRRHRLGRAAPRAARRTRRSAAPGPTRQPVAACSFRSPSRSAANHHLHHALDLQRRRSPPGFPASRAADSARACRAAHRPKRPARTRPDRP